MSTSKRLIQVSMTLALGFLGITTLLAQELDTDVIDIDSRRELFVDKALIDRLEGDVELRLHHPVPQEIVLVHDASWEGSGSLYHTIFKDGDRYRMYYRGLQMTVRDGKVIKPHRPVVCYAECRDGIHWTKPDLGLVEFNGSTENNIVWDGVGTHNFVPFKDSNPDAKPEARYKAVGGTGGSGLSAFQSPDGIHWSLVRKEPILTKGAFDSQNLVFWDAVRGEYRAYWRYFESGESGGHRAIRTATSEDFLHWSEPVDLRYADSPAVQLYTNQIKPYYRAPHIFIGFPARYIDRGWSESMRSLPQLDHRRRRAAIVARYGTAITEGLLMASRDGVTFKRWNSTFLRPGIERPGTWNYGHQYIAWHVVETESPMKGAPNELSLYASESYWTGDSSALRRYTLRLDGFISVHAPMAGGELITKPIRFKGDELTLNFSSSAAGGVRVEIQDAAGNPIPGFALEDCPPIFGDAIERVVTWKNGSDVSTLARRPVRLRFALKDADVYTFQFKKLGDR